LILQIVGNNLLDILFKAYIDVIKSVYQSQDLKVNKIKLN